MFNNAVHSNAVVLRNSYDHGNSPVDDTNSSQFARDYYLFLMLIIEITLKISEELIRCTGNGGDLEFIDWSMHGSILLITANNDVGPKRLSMNLRGGVNEFELQCQANHTS